jgi:hypothetical protein
MEMEPHQIYEITHEWLLAVGHWLLAFGGVCQQLKANRQLHLGGNLDS